MADHPVAFGKAHAVARVLLDEAEALGLDAHRVELFRGLLDEAVAAANS